MSLDGLPASAPQRPACKAEVVVRRVDRASPHPDRIRRAEELRLQLADEIVGGAPIEANGVSCVHRNRPIDP
jgi:hypothetical protein